MIPNIKKYIESHWDEFFEEKPSTLQFLLLSNPQGKKVSHGKCTVLVFKNKEAEPVLVCKFMRVNTYEDSKIVKENKILQQINVLSNSTAKPYSLKRICDKTVSFESYIPGVSIKEQLCKFINQYHVKSIDDTLSLFENHLSLVKNALQSIQVKEIENPDVESSDYLTISLGNLENLIALLQLPKAVQETINQTVSTYLELIQDRDEKLIHLDLTPSNVLISEDQKIHFIDFEFSTYSKHEFLDPIRFIFYYFHLCHQKGILPYTSYKSNFYYFFQENEEIKEMLDDFIDGILSSKNLSINQYLLLFLLGNLQLQICEHDVLDEQFVHDTKELIFLLIQLAEGNHPDLDYEKNASKDTQPEYSATILFDELTETRKYLEKCLEVIKEKDLELQENVGYISKCHETIKEKDQQLADNITYIDKCHSTIHDKDTIIEILNIQSRQNEEYYNNKSNEFEQIISGLHDKINTLEHIRKMYEKTFHSISRNVWRSIKTSFLKR